MVRSALQLIRVGPVLRRPLLTLTAIVFLFEVSIYSQSTDQNFPTPVRNNEINGVIKSRDVGDARLTTHFYTFDGSQGDLFVNIQTSNFAGDLDIFMMPGLRPLSKIVIYPDLSVAETGRVLYLRKAETLLLRIEGRSPGDDDATYRIKFAGSFVASRAEDVLPPEVPKAKTDPESSVRVNSVGTIIEIIPKVTPSAKAVETAVIDAAKSGANEKDAPEDARTVTEAKRIKPPKEEKTAPPKTEVIVSDPLESKTKEGSPKVSAKVTPGKRNRTGGKAKPAAKGTTEEVAKTENPKVMPVETPSVPTSRPPRKKLPVPREEKPVDPMANIRLVIRFKDGSVIERPMTEVFRFSVERAILTVISKEGTIGHYKMTDILGVTIE